MSRVSFWLSLFLLTSSGYAQGTLTVHVDGFQNNSGQALVAVHNTKDTFLKHREPFRHAIVKIAAHKSTVTFENLPFGDYSVSVFHDENANKDLDAYFGIIPKEDYGFSNNVKKKYGPPKFKDTLFSFNTQAQQIEITLTSALKKGAKPPSEEVLKKLSQTAE